MQIFYLIEIVQTFHVHEILLLQNPCISSNDRNCNLNRWNDLHKLSHDVFTTSTCAIHIQFITTSLSSSKFFLQVPNMNLLFNVSIKLCNGKATFMITLVNVNASLTALQCRNSGCTLIALLLSFLNSPLIFWIVGVGVDSGPSHRSW